MKGKNLLLITALTLAMTMSACGSVKKEIVDEKIPTAATMPEGKLKSGTKVVSLSAETSYVVEESIVGYYKVIKMTSEGEDITDQLETLQSMGGGIFMVIHEDNTGEIDMLGEITKIEIADDELIIKNEDGSEAERMPFVFEEGNIKLAQGVDEMEFTRMSDDEIEAFKNGESGKSVDDITQDLIDNAFDEATGEVNEEYKDAIKSIDEGAIVEGVAEEGGITAQSDDTYLPDFSASTHEDSGYYEIMVFQDSTGTYTSEQLDAAGIAFNMMLCADGTGFAHFIGTYYDLSWEDGTIVVATDAGQEKMVYYAQEYEGKQVITISDNNIAMVFENKSEAEPTYEWQGNSGLSN